MYRNVIATVDVFERKQLTRSFNVSVQPDAQRRSSILSDVSNQPRPISGQLLCLRHNKTLLFTDIIELSFFLFRRFSYVQILFIVYC